MSAPKRKRPRAPSVNQRLGAIDERLKRIEEELAAQKKAEATAQTTRSKWADRIWDILKPIPTFALIALLIYAGQSLQCVPIPTHNFAQRIEVKP